MIRYVRTLDAAGVTDSALRRGYRKTAFSLLRSDPQHHLAIRLLIPARLQPHLVAAYWFAAAADGVADDGPASGRLDRFDAWTRTTGPQGTGNRPGTPLSAFWHTVEAIGLPRRRIQALLDGLRTDAAAGARVLDEDGLQQYVDRVSLPYLMLLVGVHPECQGSEASRLFRPLALACQRIDFLADLAQDLRAERPRLAHEPAARAAHRTRARADLQTAGDVLSDTPEELLPMMRAFLRLHELRLDTIDRCDPELEHRSVRTPLLPAFRILAVAAGEAAGKAAQEAVRD